METFREFLVRNGLIDAVTGEKLEQFIWYAIFTYLNWFILYRPRCTDGPFDIRDFVVKQCFISKVDTIPDSCIP